MDTVTCAVCRKETSPGDYCRVCRSRLEVATPASAPAAEAAPAAASGQCPAPGCGQPIDTGDTKCRYCGEPVAGAPSATASTLAFPWGSHVLRDGETIELGRADPPFAAQLADYPNVGRTHVRIVRAGGALLVTDLDSINGTFVDGRRLPPHSPNELQPGQVLRLAASLEIEIR